MRNKLNFLKIFGLVLMLSGWLLTGAPSADAHANLVRSDPPADAVIPSGEAPFQVQLWFSEQPDPNYSSIRVVDSRNQLVSTGNLQTAKGNPLSLIIALKPQLPDGTFTVVWKTASSVDGHIVKSAFSFVVGSPGPAGSISGTNLDEPQVSKGNDTANLSPVGVFTRWLNYVAGAMLVGCAGFALLIWQPALKLQQRQKSLEDGKLSALESAGWSRLNRLGGLAILGLAAGWLAGLVYQLTEVTGRSWTELDLYGSPLTDFALNSRYGQIWLVRLGILVVAMLTLNFAVANKSSQKQLYLRGWWALLALGAALLLTTSLNSHAAAQLDLTWLTVGADWVHLLGTAVWIGGVFSLLWILPSLLQHLTPGTGERTRFLAVLIPLFSKVALASVVVLVVSGVYSSLLEVGSVDALFGTLYGQVLVAKLVLFGFTLAIAAGNLLRISPKMVKWANGTKAGGMQAGRLQFRFKQAIALEGVLLLAVLLSVGVLTSLEPARAPGGNAVAQNMVQSVEGINFDLNVTPAQTGINNFTLKLTGSDGKPITNTSLVQLRVQMVEMDMGVSTLQMKPSARPGEYTATGTIVSMVGTWRINALVQRTGQNDVTAPFVLQVKN